MRIYLPFLPRDPDEPRLKAKVVGNQGVVLGRQLLEDQITPRRALVLEMAPQVANGQS